MQDSFDIHLSTNTFLLHNHNNDDILGFFFPLQKFGMQIEKCICVFLKKLNPLLMRNDQELSIPI